MQLQHSPEVTSVTADARPTRPIHADDSSATKHIVVREIDNAARSTIGVVESTVAYLERLQLANFHRQPHRLLESTRQS